MTQYVLSSGIVVETDLDISFGVASAGSVPPSQNVPDTSEPVEAEPKEDEKAEAAKPTPKRAPRKRAGVKSD